MTTPAKPFIVWDNRLADATPVASSTAAGAAINLADFRPYTSWQPSSIPATVTVDCGSAKSVDCLAVFNHDLYTNGCTIQVRGSTDNFSTSDVLVHSYTPTADTAFIRNFTSASYRYWRISITAGTAPTLTICAIGVGLELPSELARGFSPVNRDMVSQVNIGETGLPLGSSVMFESWTETIAMRYVTQAWLRATWLPAWKAHLRNNPFLFAYDLPLYPSEIYLVTAGKKFRAPIVSAALANLTFDITGVALP